MPDSNNSQSLTTSAAPLSSPPPSGSNSAPAEYRFANDASVPEYARGRSAQEILGLTQRLVERFTPPPTPAPQAPTQGTYTAPGSDDYITGAQLAASQQDAFQRYVQPDMTAGIDLAASANYGLTQSKYQKEFSKYGPEIVGRLAGVPKKLWTLDNLETVVKLVRADHFADYQAEWQTENRASIEATIRSSGVGGSPPVPQDNKENSLESEKIPDEWKLRAAKAGVTEATVREFCATNEMTAAEFYKQFETPKNAIVAEVPSGR